MDGKMKITFADAFGNGVTHNGVELFHPSPYLNTKNRLPSAKFLPNTTLSPDCVPDPPDGQWTGLLKILTGEFDEDYCKVIKDFTISVDFAKKRIEGFGFFKDEYRFAGFCLNGKFNNYHQPKIYNPNMGEAAFGISNGTDTLEYADNARASLTFLIGKKGIVGYFMSGSNIPHTSGIPYTGGFVVRPPQ